MSSSGTRCGMMASEPTLPGMEIWVPEGEYEDTPYPVEEEIYRVIDEHGKLDGRNTYYSTLKGAKAYIAGHWAGKNATIQKGKVTWNELD